MKHVGGNYNDLTIIEDKNMNQNNHSNTLKWKNLKCLKCGKTNIGWQTHCLLCQADLTDVEPHTVSYRLCQNCGAKLQLGEKFCTHCGTAVPKEEIPKKPKPQVAKCPNCGAALKSDAKFCTQCGTKV